MTSNISRIKGYPFSLNILLLETNYFVLILIFLLLFTYFEQEQEHRRLNLLLNMEHRLLQTKDSKHAVPGSVLHSTWVLCQNLVTELENCWMSGLFTVSTDTLHRPGQERQDSATPPLELSLIRNLGLS